MKNIFKRMLTLLMTVAIMVISAQAVSAVDYLVDAETLHPENFDAIEATISLYSVQEVAAPDGYLEPTLGMPIAMSIGENGQIKIWLGGYVFTESNADITPLMREIQAITEEERETLFVKDWEYSAIAADGTPRRIVVNRDDRILQFVVEESIDEIEPEIIELALKIVVMEDQNQRSRAIEIEEASFSAELDI